MNTELRPKETTIKMGFANCMRGWEGVGGRLFLTDQRLVFESHAFNIQCGVTEVELPDISAVKLVWSRFLNVPMLPNGLEVTTFDGIAHTFVVYGRKHWKTVVEQQCRGAKVMSNC